MSEKEEERKAELFISRGQNGNGAFSLFYNETRAPIITDKPMEDIASHIVREFPKTAKAVTQTDQCFGDVRKDINLLMEPSDGEKIVLLIVQKFNTAQREKQTVYSR